MFGSIAAATIGAILLGANMQANAAENAAHDQSQAALAGTGESARQFNVARNDQMPWLTAGSAGIGELQQLLGLGGIKTRDQIYKELFDKASLPGTSASLNGAGYYKYADGTTGYTPKKTLTPKELAAINAQADQQFSGQHADPAGSPLLRQYSMQDWENDPVRQIMGNFALDQGTKAINARAAANGNWDSGGTLKALDRYATDYGAQRAGESYNRFTQNQANVYNRLAGIAGTGQTSAQQLGNMGMNYAGQVSNNFMNAANARGAAGVAEANAYGGALNNGLQSGLNYFQNQNMLNRLGNLNGNQFSTAGGGYNYGLGQPDFSAGYY